MPHLPRLCGRAAPELDFFSMDTGEWVPKPKLNVQLDALGIAARLLSSAVHHSGSHIQSSTPNHYDYVTTAKHKMGKEE